MVNFYNNLSPATKLLIQSFLAILGAAIAGGVTAAYQSYLTSNQLNLQVLVNVSLLTFSLLFGKAMHDWIPAHAQQLLQAAQDEKAALYNALQKSQQVTSAVIATQGSQVQSTSPQAQIQPALKQEDIQAIGQQLAMNLITMSNTNLANNSKLQASAPAMAPIEEPYEDPLKVSLKLPAYKPVDNTTNLNMAGGTAVQYSATQTQFQIPPRPQSAIMP